MQSLHIKLECVPFMGMAHKHDYIQTIIMIMTIILVLGCCDMGNNWMKEDGTISINP